LLPIVAIGGITLADVPAILQQGVSGIAVSQAISGDIATQVPAFRDAIGSVRLSSTVDN
jgi:thiamine-phosphate pyrophosphorylase